MVHGNGRSRVQRGALGQPIPTGPPIWGSTWDRSQRENGVRPLRKKGSDPVVPATDSELVGAAPTNSATVARYSPHNARGGRPPPLDALSRGGARTRGGALAGSRAATARSRTATRGR